MNNFDLLLIGKIIIFACIFLVLMFGVRFLKTKLNKIKGHKILKLYNQKDLKRIEVKISETKYPIFSNRGGTLGFINATLFYSDAILIFTQRETSNFEKLNSVLPLVVKQDIIKDIIIRNDEYILDIINSKSRMKIQIYSEKENDILNHIINNFKRNILEV